IFFIFNLVVLQNKRGLIKIYSTIHCPSVVRILKKQHTETLACNDGMRLVLKEKAFDYSSQKASFAGRVSFGLKEETSGGLQAGDVSLKLEKATIEDIGTYTCYVSSSVAYSSASVSLTVTAVMKDDNKVNLSCQSDGWYPKPELSWSDNKTALTPANVMFSRISAGFYSVHSWVLVSSPSEVSCSVGLFNEEPKEARMRLENPSSLQEGTRSHLLELHNMSQRYCHTRKLIRLLKCKGCLRRPIEKTETNILKMLKCLICIT
uniref:Ig-like domain-containing protein n=1 Tax=Poecilia mexicana TaxID=48701 RepID=A0A3B3YGL8_9TELE